MKEYSFNLSTLKYIIEDCAAKILGPELTSFFEKLPLLTLCGATYTSYVVFKSDFCETYLNGTSVQFVSFICAFLDFSIFAAFLLQTVSNSCSLNFLELMTILEVALSLPRMFANSE